MTNSRSIDDILCCSCRWRDDTEVEPRETSHFEFYVPGQDTAILPLRESRIYQEDWIGLRTLDEAGRLHFLVTEGDHMDLNRQWFTDNVVNVFLV